LEGELIMIKKDNIRLVEDTIDESEKIVFIDDRGKIPSYRDILVKGITTDVNEKDIYFVDIGFAKMLIKKDVPEDTMEIVKKIKDHPSFNSGRLSYMNIAGNVNCPYFSSAEEAFIAMAIGWVKGEFIMYYNTAINEAMGGLLPVVYPNDFENEYTNMYKKMESILDPQGIFKQKIILKNPSNLEK
jgi:hypothetical protein